MTENQRARLNKVFKDYELNKKEHVAEENDFIIVNRTGIMALKKKR